MKLLTDKALEHFEEWLIKEPNRPFAFWYRGFNSQSGWIIDWFDSVRICFDVSKLSLTDKYYADIWLEPYQEFDCGNNYNTRQEAIKAAITKANEIYNQNLVTNL